MQFLFNFIMFILLLMVIVVVHEFGHLITAKHFNVYWQRIFNWYGACPLSK